MDVCSKWKADKGAVTSIAVCPTDCHLLSAGRTIKLWDLETRQLLKVRVLHRNFLHWIVFHRLWSIDTNIALYMFCFSLIDFHRSCDRCAMSTTSAVPYIYGPITEWCYRWWPLHTAQHWGHLLLVCCHRGQTCQCLVCMATMCRKYWNISLLYWRIEALRWIINYWSVCRQINTSSTDKSSMASFALTEEPVKMFISPPKKDGQVRTSALYKCKTFVQSDVQSSWTDIGHSLIPYYDHCTSREK